MTAAASQPRSLFVLSQDNLQKLYGQGAAEAIAERVDLVADRQDPDGVVERCPQLAEAELLFTGWGGPKLDSAFLAAATSLKVVFYGAGSVRGVVTDAMWERGVRIVSAWAANAVPVAEYALAQILLALKLGWHYARGVCGDRRWEHSLPSPGAYGSTVGLVSLGQIGRRVCEHLQHFELNVIAHDPFVSAAEAEALGVELADLANVFRRADVVSLHAPNLPEIEGLITGELLASMKPYATFINTARGAIVREDEMIAVLQQRPDLMAVLDVTHPEPPEADSPLWTLANVVLTPHIAGSLGSECARMGWLMVAELDRCLSGQPFEHEITRDQAGTLA